MKHIMLSSAWKFEVEPFPAYRVNLVYGRNKWAREFLPVKGVNPITTYTVTAECGQSVLYTGTDEAKAKEVKEAYDAEQKTWERANFNVSLPTLPEDKFRVIKTREKGTILIVPGEEKTNRCLLFVGCAGGFRGGESVLKDGTTGTILKICSAGNACESSTEVIVLLEPGQTIAFHTFGRRTNEAYLYTWNGAALEKKHFSKAEWDNRNVAGNLLEDAEVL